MKCYLARMLIAFILSYACANQSTGLASPEHASPGAVPSSNKRDTQYLLFQFFTNEKDFGGNFPPSASIEENAEDLLRRIGASGDARHKLGICIGPLTLGQSDARVRQLIKQGFALARKFDLAIAFHIDDQMFWQANPDLGSKETLEWTDWNGGLSQARQIDWGASAGKGPAILCMNNPKVVSVVSGRAKLLGLTISQEVQSLKHDRKDHLFAGVIAGWETMIGKEYGTHKRVGFHALKNEGLSQVTPEDLLDKARVKSVKEFIDLWARNLISGGIAKEKIYSHIAMTDQGFEESARSSARAEAFGYAVPDVAFASNYRPGFSTYPSEDAFDQIYKALSAHKTSAWISAEGTNMVPSGVPGEANMETYLAKTFNHGGVLCNIFSWGIGGESEKQRNAFRKATENQEAITAYRKFLNGEKLIEKARSKNTFSQKHLAEKVRKIQMLLPAWVQRTRKEATARELMQRLDNAMRSQKFEEADSVADEILRAVSAK